MKHTPGPWTADCEDESSVVYAAGDCARITDVRGSDNSVRVDQANARLIAAAPELLAFAKWYVAFCDDGEGAIAPGYDAAKRVVALAEGKP